MNSAANFSDWQAICNVKARYCRFLDAKQWDDLRGLLVDDFKLDVSGSGGPVFENADEAVASVRKSLEGVRTVHHLHAPEIEINGDEASVVFAMQDRLYRGPDTPAMTGYGHYVETYRRVNGEWKIAKSALTRLFMEVGKTTLLGG